MKKTKEMKEERESKKELQKGKRNIWKIVSIVFIAVFALIVAWGLIKSYHFRPHFTSLNQEQIDSAKTAAYNDLTGKGISVPMESIKVANGIRPLPGKQEKRIIEVSVDVNSVRHVYLIDSGSNAILMHSETEFFGWMNDSKLFPKEGMKENKRFASFPRPVEGR